MPAHSHPHVSAHLGQRALRHNAAICPPQNPEPNALFRARPRGIRTVLCQPGRGIRKVHSCILVWVSWVDWPLSSRCSFQPLPGCTAAQPLRKHRVCGPTPEDPPRYLPGTSEVLAVLGLGLAAEPRVAPEELVVAYAV
eukprot:2775531-Rhodomonas_salina.2